MNSLSENTFADASRAIQCSLSVHTINPHTGVPTRAAVAATTTAMVPFTLESTVFPQHNSVDLPMTFQPVFHKIGS